MPHPAMSWHTLYPTMPASAWVAEAPATWHHTIPEKLVRCLWFDQRWRPAPLRTLDGREITVHTPGRWNLQADFLVFPRCLTRLSPCRLVYDWSTSGLRECS